MLWQRGCLGFRAASVLQYRFYLFEIVLCPVKGSVSVVAHTGELCTSNLAVASQTYPHYVFVQPLATFFFMGWASRGLIDLWSMQERDLSLYLQFLSTGWTSLLRCCRPIEKKSSMAMSRCFCLFTSPNLSTYQDQTLKSYWIHILFLIAKVQTTVSKENHVSRGHEMQKVRHR